MSDLERLKTRKWLLSRRLIKTNKYIKAVSINKVSVDLKPSDIKLRINSIKKIWSRFVKMQSVIDQYRNESKGVKEYSRTKIEEIYVKTVALGKSLLYILKNGGAVDINSLTITVPALRLNSSSCNLRTSLSIKLAVINVPIFTGAYENWSVFHDIFTAEIHNNPRIDDVERFIYLRWCLRKEAAQVIMYIEITAANYSVAWNSLVARYNHEKVLLVQSHVKELFDLPAVNEEAAQLRTFIDQLNGHINSLKALGEKPKDWGALLIHVISIKLDSNMLKAWEMMSPQNEVLKIESLLEFLEKRFKHIETASLKLNTNGGKNRKKNDISNKAKNNKNDNEETFALSEDMKCDYCHLNHFVFKCPSFRALSVQDRIQIVTELKLCKVCLRSNHMGVKCKGKACIVCNRYHNTMLHLRKNSKNIAAVSGR